MYKVLLKRKQTFLSLCCSSLKALFSPRSFSTSREGSLAPSSRPCCTRCCILMKTKITGIITILFILLLFELTSPLTRWHIYVGLCVYILSNGGQKVPLPALLILQRCVFFPQLRARRLYTDLQFSYLLLELTRLLFSLDKLTQKNKHMSRFNGLTTLWSSKNG